MPIRFRCAYCNQLMGIARRKAGTVVRCPTCSGQVVVPDPGPTVAAPQEAANRPKLALFERSDFEEVFRIPPQGQPAPTDRGPAPPPAVPRPAPVLDVEPVALSDQRAARPGLFLSPGKLTFLSVLLVLLLGLAFFAGLLVGRGL
jgi:hypothetical protein